MPWHTDLVAVAELRPPGKLFSFRVETVKEEILR